MSVYSADLDDDSTIIRVDDNITETAGTAINQLRDAVFNMQAEMGINPSGSLSSIADRLNVSLDAAGNIKASALASVGLVTLPIDNAQVGINAGIKETKLDLDFGTSNLNTLIQGNTTLLNAWVATVATLNTNFASHLLGGPASSLRHVASHIDIGSVPTDTRDTTFTWTGIRDKDGALYSATNAAEALAEVATNLGDHQNQAAAAHAASAVSVDTSSFTTLDTDSDTVQKALDNIDDVDELKMGTHRSTMHSPGVPRDARSELLSVDGYAEAVVAPTAVSAYLAHNPPGTAPVDSVYVGDDIVKFTPPTGAAQFVFEAGFSQVRPGDIITINYGNGVEAEYEIDSTRFIPNSEWYVRLNGTNLFETADGYARIDRKKHDENVYGVLSVASANAIPSVTFPSIRGGLIVGDPKGATALGLGFDPNQLDALHYKLYLQIYPTGDPSAKIINLPFVDVTGNAGATVGNYTVESVVQETNNKFREAGYNYRFISFSVDGNFGIMLADSIDGASFSIISGDNSSGTLAEGIYTENVVGDANPDLKEFDALGLGTNGSNTASPAYQSSFLDSTAALLPTRIIVPKRYRDYVVNGFRFNELAAAPSSNTSRYWTANLTSRTATASTVEVTYTVDLDLRDAELMPGKSIVVLPSIDFSNILYNDVDYGRFIIKEITYDTCGGVNDTHITVINGIHGTGVATGFSSNPTLPVRLYFSEDSVWFNEFNVINSAPSGDYHRWHEVYVTDTKKTFAHERSRMPANQAEGANTLPTRRWRIRETSSKLRGYRDTGSTDFNKWIRFYILSYDSTSGEYDGYIGQRNSSDYNIYRTGPTTTGRKNTTTRFYDETYIDYIDLEFLEDGTSSNDIISGSTPKYVDIELFTSLQDDDELTLLATCEVSWEPTVGEVVDLVKDHRPIGSISEEEFTQSAKDFISAADRHLTANGIIRGFNYTGQNSNDNREFYFNGGIAIVNGAVVTANQGSVTIPEVFEDSVGTPDTINWAICVDESGNFVPIILTSTKQQFFAEDNVSTEVYYLPSVTFTELINTRKDLTIINIINVTISSFTFNSETDARRFVDNETLDIPFSLTMPVGDQITKLVGNFTSLEQAGVWISNYGYQTGNSVIKVRGTFTDSVVDLTDFNGVIFEGDSQRVAQLQITTSMTIPTSVTFNNMTIILQAGAYIDATLGQPTFDNCLIGILGTDKAIRFNNSLTVRNCSVSYVPATPPTAGTDFIHTGNGAFYCDASSVSHSSTIENTTFSATTNRPPFINVEIDRERVLDTFTVRGCVFNDSNSGGKYRAAIAIIGTNDGSGVKPIVFNALIENNICADFQGIYLTSTALTPSDYPLATVACRILNNSSGTIGYWTVPYTGWGSSAAGGPRGEDGNKMGSLDIRGNTTAVISACKAQGEAIGASVIDSGNIVIEGNFTHAIFAKLSSTEPSAYGKIHILNNTIEASDLSNYSSAFSVLTNGINIGQMIDARSTSADVIINGNTIRSGYVDASQYKFVHGIKALDVCTITNNYIFEWTGYGINVAEVTAGGSLITNNRLFRNGSSVTGYISFKSTAGNSLIADNFLDSNTNGTDTNNVNIGGAANTVICRDNINQTVTIDVAPIAGTTLSEASAATSAATAYVDRSNTIIWGDATVSTLRGWVQLLYVANAIGYQRLIRTQLNLAQILPPGSRLVEAVLTFNYSRVPTSTKDVRIELHDLNDVQDLPTGGDVTAASILDTTITITESDFVNKAAWLATSDNSLICTAGCKDNSNNGITITLKKVEVSYRW